MSNYLIINFNNKVNNINENDVFVDKVLGEFKSDPSGSNNMYYLSFFRNESLAAQDTEKTYKGVKCYMYNNASNFWDIQVYILLKFYSIKFDFIYILDGYNSDQWIRYGLYNELYTFICTQDFKLVLEKQTNGLYNVYGHDIIGFYNLKFDSFIKKIKLYSYLDDVEFLGISMYTLTSINRDFYMPNENVYQSFPWTSLPETILKDGIRNAKTPHLIHVARPVAAPIAAPVAAPVIPIARPVATQDVDSKLSNPKTILGFTKINYFKIKVLKSLKEEKVPDSEDNIKELYLFGENHDAFVRHSIVSLIGNNDKSKCIHGIHLLELLMKDKYKKGIDFYLETPSVGAMYKKKTESIMLMCRYFYILSYFLDLDKDRTDINYSKYDVLSRIVFKNSFSNYLKTLSMHNIDIRLQYSHCFDINIEEGEKMRDLYRTKVSPNIIQYAYESIKGLQFKVPKNAERCKNPASLGFQLVKTVDDDDKYDTYNTLYFELFNKLTCNDNGNQDPIDNVINFIHKFSSSLKSEFAGQNMMDIVFYTKFLYYLHADNRMDVYEGNSNTSLFVGGSAHSVAYIKFIHLLHNYGYIEILKEKEYLPTIKELPSINVDLNEINLDIDMVVTIDDLYNNIDIYRNKEDSFDKLYTNDKYAQYKKYDEKLAEFEDDAQYQNSIIIMLDKILKAGGGIRDLSFREIEYLISDINIMFDLPGDAAQANSTVLLIPQSVRSSAIKVGGLQRWIKFILE